MLCYIILTALTVSIDSFVCGFSLSCLKNKKTPIVFGIAATVFVMCALANYLTCFLAGKITEKNVSLGGLVLIGVGVFNLLKKRSAENEKALSNSFYQSLITGFAVGLDGAFANLSLSLMGLNAFYVPVIIAVMHAVMICLGILLSKTAIARKFAKIEFVPPLVLILLGGYKLLGLFI